MASRSFSDELRRLMRGLIGRLEVQHAVYPVDKDGVTPLMPVLP